MSGDDNVRREAELWALHARAQAAEERALEAERQHDAVVDYAREELRLRQAEQRERRLTLAGLLQAYHTIDKLKVNSTSTSTKRSQTHTRRAAGRLCPRDIIPWQNFPEEIIGIYDKLNESYFFPFGRTFYRLRLR